jgi:hypothetical protein
MVTCSMSCRPIRRNNTVSSGKRFLSVKVLSLAVLLFLVVFMVTRSPTHHDKLKYSSLYAQINSTNFGLTSSDESPLSTSSAENCNQFDIEIYYQKLLFNANAKIAERRDWINQDSERAWFEKLDGERLWYLFTPVLPCFWTLEKEPGVRKRHDGGKWLCGAQELHQSRRRPSAEYGVGQHYNRNNSCIVYSMGSCNQFDFEERVRHIAPGCEIHTFDPTFAESGIGKPFYDAYHGDYGFGGIDNTEERFPVKSLPTIMKELGHKHVDYLKIDVEGYEWPFLDAVDWSVVRIGNLLMELHPSPDGKKFLGVNPTAKEMNDIFDKLEQAGFYEISLEPVTFTNFGQVEIVFIHKDWRPEGWRSSPITA